MFQFIICHFWHVPFHYLQLLECTSLLLAIVGMFQFITFNCWNVSVYYLQLLALSNVSSLSFVFEFSISRFPSDTLYPVDSDFRQSHFIEFSLDSLSHLVSCIVTYLSHLIPSVQASLSVGSVRLV